MVGFKRDEIIGISELRKSLGKYLDLLSSKKINKIVVFRKSKPEVVVLSIAEYERLKIASDLFIEMKKNQFSD